MCIFAGVASDGTYLFGFTSPTFLSAETEKERLCLHGNQLDEGGHHVQCCAKHTRCAWLVGHNAVQAVWKQAEEEAGFTARVDVAHGLPRELHLGMRSTGSCGVPTRERVCASEHR